jgi:hypothetical protein
LEKAELVDVRSSNDTHIKKELEEEEEEEEEETRRGEHGSSMGW